MDKKTEVYEQDHLVPTRLLRPLIQTYLDANQMSAKTFSEVTGRDIVAIMSRHESIQFTAADAIICKMGIPYVWYYGELSFWYSPRCEKGHLSTRRKDGRLTCLVCRRAWDAKRRELTRAGRTGRVLNCKWCGEPFAPKVTKQGGTREQYCAEVCRRAAHNKRERDSYQKRKENNGTGRRA